MRLFCFDFKSEADGNNAAIEAKAGKADVADKANYAKKTSAADKTNKLD